MPKPKKTILIIGARPQEFASWRQSLQSEDSTETWLCQEAVHQNNSEQDYLNHQPDCVVLADSLLDADIMATLAQLQSVAGTNLAPVLIVTSADQEKQAQEALKHGAVNYLFKEDLTARGLRSAVYAALRQEELRQDRDSFQDSVENAPVGVHWISPDGVILWANQAEMSLLGYTREEYIGRSVVDFHTDPSAAASMMEKLSQHETLHNFEAQLRCKDGSCRDVLVSSNVRWEKGTFIHTRCFTRDITDRKKVEAELHVRTTQLQVISDNIPTLIAHCDSEGRYRFVNQPYAQQFGLKSEQIIGKTLPEVIGAQAYAELKPYFDTALSGQRVEFETEIPGPGLHKQFVHVVYIPKFDAHGEVRGVIATFTDISERKQAELDLLTLTAKIAWQAKAFDTTLSTITDYVFRFDRNGRFLYANQPLLDLWGLKTEEAIGKTMAELNYPKEVETKILADIGQVFDQQQPVKNETPYPSPHGYDGYYEYILCPFLSADGMVEYVVGSARDITERKKVELKLEQVYLKETAARAEAEAANRAKDEFLAVVSHELRAPLNAMLGWAKILQGKNYTPATLEHAIEVIERSARSQQKMIEDLLDSARIISGNLRLEIQPVEMTSVIEATLETVRLAAEAKGLALEVSCLPVTDIITGDAHRLQQVIWNLISNAVKFTPQGGCISVRLERVDPYLQLTVSDTGKGISPDFMPYIFNRFHQADSSITRRHSGLGLGLSLVRHLVELHGGTVKAESPGEGQGATFTVRLPFRAVRTAVDESISTGARRKLRLNQLAALKGLHILVVDDESDARELVTVMLEENGAQVTGAGSVTEALRLLTGEQRLHFDAIVSDIGMPEENGYTLIRQVRRLPAAQGGQLPAIALTAFGRASDRIAALSAGFQMHVPKPVEAAELVMVIASLTGRAELGENV